MTISTQLFNTTTTKRYCQLLNSTFVQSALVCLACGILNKTQLSTEVLVVLDHLSCGENPPSGILQYTVRRCTLSKCLNLCMPSDIVGPTFLLHANQVCQNIAAKAGKGTYRRRVWHFFFVERYQVECLYLSIPLFTIAYLASIQETTGSTLGIMIFGWEKYV